MKNSFGFIFVFIAIIIVYLIGLPIDVMDIDAAQYAGISSDMFTTGEYLKLYCKENDYLDKPPFLFWINQPFFFIFGIHDWSYKLGSLLFIFIGLYSTYRLAKLIYNHATGLFAATILGTTQAWFLITHDVKTDGILASAVIFSVWQWKCFIENNKIKNLFALSIGIAIGMLTKGPIGLMVPLLAIGCDLLVNKKIKQLFTWKYLIGLLLISIMLAPMLYGLYQQYDLHPGKIVSGGEVVNSGIRYYFWTQSFGRITGESVWNSNSSVFYFIPELMWSFLPWVLFAVQSIFKGFRIDFKRNIIPLAGFILPFIALSLSHYKLSHYIFICYPFLAILVAHYLNNLNWSLPSKIISYLFQFMVLTGIFVLGCCFAIPIWIMIIISIAIIVMIILKHINKNKIHFFSLVIAAIGLNIFLTGFAYPALLEYQGSSKAAQEYVRQQPDKKIPLIEVGIWSFSMEFYAQTNVKTYSNISGLITNEPPGEYWLYMDDNNYQQLLMMDIEMQFEKLFHNYPVTRLKPAFIWPATRGINVSKTHLVKVYLR